MSSRLRLFLTSSAIDGLLVICLSLALAYAVMSGFDSTVSLRNAWMLQLAVVVPAVVILFFGSWSKRRLAPSAIGFIVWGAVVIAVAQSLSMQGVAGEASGIEDVEGNYSIFVIVLLVCTVFVFLLSRRVAGTILLLVAGVLLCGSVQFLYREWASDEGGLICFIAVALLSVAMMSFQSYRSQTMRADILEKPAFAMAALQGLAMGGIALGCGFLLWTSVIEPLGLSTPVVKPFERVIARPIIEYTGTYAEVVVEDPNTFSSIVSDEEDETQNNAAGGTAVTDESESTPDDPLAQLVQSIMVFSPESWSEDLDPASQRNFVIAFGVFIQIAIVLLILLLILGRMMLRRLRLRRWRKLDRIEGTRTLYEFLLNRFSKLGIKKAQSATPLEFAFDQRHAMVPFTRGTLAMDFIDLTLIYQRARYGSSPPSVAEWRAMERYYREFFQNAHRWVGTPRWLLYFWRI